MTGFEKTRLPRTSNFMTLANHNLLWQCTKGLKFWHIIFISYKNDIWKIQPSSALPKKVLICQSYEIGCVWKPGFLKSSHICKCLIYSMRVINKLNYICIPKFYNNYIWQVVGKQVEYVRSLLHMVCSTHCCVTPACLQKEYVVDQLAIFLPTSWLFVSHISDQRRLVGSVATNTNYHFIVKRYISKITTSD